MISGKQLRDAFISGANNLTNKKTEVDALNVFPVPDGDTGTNMSMTVGNGVIELQKLEDTATVAQVSKTAASSFLRGARGNSGVILSLLFRGFAQGLKEKETATGSDIATAFSIGVEAAYKAVMKPTEGTILTVARCSAEKATEIAKYDDSISAVFYGMYIQSQKTLSETPDLLPILKKSGVVDAGGQGLVYIMEGIWHYLSEGEMIEIKNSSDEDESQSDTELYCCELVIDRYKTGKDSEILKSFLQSSGELVLFENSEKDIKIHIHCEDPGKIISESLTYGTLSTIKAENLSISHNVILNNSKKSEREEQFKYASVNPNTEYGFVSVCAGAGFTDIFNDLGCDNIVSGGQTMNPSTENILAAIQATPAKNVFVLPNNKNIIMAANQAAEIADRNVIVIPSKTVPQGISAMLAYSPDMSLSENVDSMNESLSTVSTGSVTFAARDSDFDGIKIKEGELLALKEGKMIYTGQDINIICRRLAKELVTKDTSVLTIYYGEGITPAQADEIKTVIESRVSNDIEVSAVFGGQPVYYYIISAE